MLPYELCIITAPHETSSAPQRQGIYARLSALFALRSLSFCLFCMLFLAGINIGEIYTKYSLHYMLAVK